MRKKTFGEKAKHIGKEALATIGRHTYKPVVSAVRDHHRQVDQLNEHYDDFKKMKFRDKASYVLHNPLAFMLQNAEKGGTKSRNEGRKKRLDDTKLMDDRYGIGGSVDAKKFDVGKALTREGVTTSATPTGMPEDESVTKDIHDLTMSGISGGMDLTDKALQLPSMVNDIGGGFVPEDTTLSKVSGIGGSVMGGIGGATGIIRGVGDTYSSGKETVMALKDRDWSRAGRAALETGGATPSALSAARASSPHRFWAASIPSPRRPSPGLT